MPWVDDVLNGLQVQIDKLWYDLLRLLAVAGWTLQKGLFLMGHAIELINLWLVEQRLRAAHRSRPTTRCASPPACRLSSR